MFGPSKSDPIEDRIAFISGKDRIQYWVKILCLASVVMAAEPQVEGLPSQEVEKRTVDLGRGTKVGGRPFEESDVRQHPGVFVEVQFRAPAADKSPAWHKRAAESPPHRACG